MEFLSYDIESMDFREAGAASRALKERLKLIGADAEAIRRTMIAAYEAEMNVVIHSVGGRLEASVSESHVDVDVLDSGPGIPDVEKAMVEGFSTANAEARALGFGAGMGLPNIQRNSDRLRVTSRAGEGTRVSFSIQLRPGETDGAHPISLYASADRCRECRACLSACPTNAMRVRDGRPSVLEHLCIDCAECIAACRFGALGTREEVASLDDLAGKDEMVLVVPPALLAGCGPEYSPAKVLDALKTLGFADVITSEPHEAALRAATAAWTEVAHASDAAPAACGAGGAGGATGAPRPKPVIAPVCPATIGLIELRFPSLVRHLAPFDSPWEAVQAARAGRPTAYVVSCPSQRSALLAVSAARAAAPSDGRAAAPRDEYLTPAVVHQAVMTKLARGGADAAPTADPGAATAVRAPAPRAAPTAGDGVLAVTGAIHVLAVLEEIEDGLLTDVSVVEPYLCEGGCFGSPLLSEDHHVATRRWTHGRTALEGAVADATAAGAAGAPPRRRPFTARPGIRLDSDMSKAIDKLGRLQTVIDSLPGKDCGACGAPTCAALAEDIVMGRVIERAVAGLCPYLKPGKKEGRS